MPEFQRFTAPDAAQLAQHIANARERLAQALERADTLATVDHAADLGGLLTTARQEAQALAALMPHATLADTVPTEEAAGWYWCASATTL